MALNDIIGTAGARAFISASLPTTNTRLAYEKLPWVEIGLISDLGSIGKTFNETTFTPAKEGKVVPKLTASDNGETQLVYAYTAGQDVGHALLKARFGKRVSLCFALNNGKCKYFQALVKSEVVNMGTVDNIVTESCTLRLTEDDVIVAQTPYWLIDEESPYWWFMSGHYGFWVDLNPVYGKVFTTADGNTLAQNPGDPVGRVESIAGGLTLKQPSSPLRPVLARVPKGVGVVNRLPSFSNEFEQSAWLKVCSNDTPVPVVTDNYADDIYGRPTAARVQLTPPGDSQYAVIRRSGLSLPLNSTFSIFVKANGPGQIGKQVNVYIHAGGGTLAGRATLTDEWQRAVSSPTTGTTVVEVGFGKQRNTFVNGVADADAATDFLVCYAQINNGDSPLPVQVVGAGRYDITQEGVEDDWYLYSNGTQYMGFGVDTFGTADFYADATQEWTVRVDFSTFTQDSVALLAESSEMTPWPSRFLLGSGAADAGMPFSVIRQASTTTPWASAVVPNRVDTGAPQSMTVRWNGSVANGWRNGVLLSGSNPAVGTGTQPKSNITFMHRDAASPKSIFTGYAKPPFFIDKALTDDEITRIAA